MVSVEDVSSDFRTHFILRQTLSILRCSSQVAQRKCPFRHFPDESRRISLLSVWLAHSLFFLFLFFFFLFPFLSQTCISLSLASTKMVYELKMERSLIRGIGPWLVIKICTLIHYTGFCLWTVSIYGRNKARAPFAWWYPTVISCLFSVSYFIHSNAHLVDAQDEYIPCNYTYHLTSTYHHLFL